MPQPRQSEPFSKSRAMLRPNGSPSPAPDAESGFLLLFVLFLAALMLIALAVAAPRIATSIQRDREIELVHRGEQYKRAIKLYYRKFGTYPSSIDQLLDTNNIRFLRKRYTDPITGKNDWRLIHLGQAKVPPLGFFGQPLTGIPGPTNVGTPVSATAANPFANSSPASLPSNPFPSDNGDQTPDAGSSTDESSQPPADNSSSSSSASDNSATPFGSNPASPSSASASPFGPSSAASGGPGSSLGGGPIVGVGLPSPKASLLDYKKQTHYNKWEFVYNPIEDQMQAAAAALNGGNVQTMNGASSPTGFGNSPNQSSSPFGSNNGSFGNNTGSSPFGGSSNNPSPPGSNPQQ